MLITVNGKEYEGEMSLSFVEEGDGITVASITVILGVFVTSITELRCPIGIFRNTFLSHIAIGTKDHQVVYQLATNDFCLDDREINLMLTRNAEGGE